MDKFGRKPLVVLGMAGCCACLIIEAAMVAAYAREGTNKAGLKMGVAATYIFILFQTFSFDSAGLVMLAEIFPNHSRARGLALVIATIALTDLVYLEVTETVRNSRILWTQTTTDIFFLGLCSYRMEILPRLHHFIIHRYFLLLFPPSRDKGYPIGGDRGHLRRSCSGLCGRLACRSQHTSTCCRQT